MVIKMTFNKNGVDLFEKQTDVTKAKEAAKRYWDFYSILEDNLHKKEIIRNGDSYDGAHLYPSGMPKYKHIACIPANIFPMPRTAHRAWDEIRTIPDKITMLLDNTYHEYRFEITAQIEKLNRLANENIR